MALERLMRGAMGLAGVGVLAVEARYRRQPGNAVAYVDQGWGSERKAPDHLRVGGHVFVHNLLQRREVMLVDVRPRVRLLSNTDVDDLVVDADVLSHEHDYPTRADRYWTAYVVKPGRYDKPSHLEVVVDVRGPEAAVDAVYAAWLALEVDTYGFEGPRLQHHHVVVPLRFPDTETAPGGDVGERGGERGAAERVADRAAWRDAAAGRARVRPVRTHLLGPLDDPLEVVRRYAAPLARPGDIVTIGESPLAVIQGRFLDPRGLRRGWFATRAAQFMSGVGSLGTAGGMQALVGEIGAPRVAGALVGGAAGKLAGQDGWFYRLCGARARLIDDVTGTLPPYDKFIVLGPERADEVCADILRATGLQAAVVDANDLGNVDVIGSSPGVPPDLVIDALRANPAGNADETTPIVLVRPVAEGGR